jgi:16S rRNA (adenine1518-N6/adenine1519-N6)-dimethyltransferase
MVHLCIMEHQHVRAKKHLGQHFLKRPEICEQIAHALTLHTGYTAVLEIGPGTGALTEWLLRRTDFTTHVVEIDRESIAWLEVHYPALKPRIHAVDFLSLPLDRIMEQPFALIGNFPYNISSQIVFHMLEYRTWIPEMVGMFQREVAMRIAGKPGNKDYGILSVLAQAYYDIEYLFTVDEDAFVPPPKVKSGVIRMIRKEGYTLPCDEKVFKTVVKTAFNQRRKTLRNSLRALPFNKPDMSDALYNLRPEQLDVPAFITIAQACEHAIAQGPKQA